MFTSRRARVATLVAAGVLGFGGMAAASPSLLGDQPGEQEPIIEVEPVETELVDPIEDLEVVEPGVEDVQVVEPELVEAEPGEEVEPTAPAESAQVGTVEVAPADVPLVDDLATEFDETKCVAGNHGATVSVVARGEFPGDVSVTDAAHSSCGKTGEVDLDASQIVPEIEPEAELEQERPGRDERAASDGKANGNSNGKSNGNSGQSKRDD